MSAEQIMGDLAVQQDWDTEQQLALALRYIENQEDDPAFEDFLDQLALLQGPPCRTCGDDTAGGDGEGGECGNCADRRTNGKRPHQLQYSRFMGQHEGEIFPDVDAAVQALKDELADLRQTPHGAPWRRVTDPGPGYDMKGVIVLYEHVGWDATKPERIALVEVEPDATP